MRVGDAHPAARSVAEASVIASGQWCRLMAISRMPWRAQPVQRVGQHRPAVDRHHRLGQVQGERAAAACPPPRPTPGPAGSGAAPRNLLHPAAQQARQQVIQHHVQVLLLADVSYRRADAQVDQAAQATAFIAGQPGRRWRPAARHPQSLQHVGAVAAARDCDHQVAGPAVVAQLLGEHLVVGRVVGPGGEQWDVVGQAERAPARLAVHDDLVEVVDHVRGQRRAAAVAHDQHLAI